MAWVLGLGDRFRGRGVRGPFEHGLPSVKGETLKHTSLGGKAELLNLLGSRV